MSISTIIVTRNRANKLRRCVKSIIEGTNFPDELLIIDNNSTDNTKDMMQKIIKTHDQNIRYVLEKNEGIPFARNRGLKESKFDIVAFTDDDCVVDKNWIRNILHAHSKYPTKIIIGGNTLNYKNSITGYAAHLFRKYITLSDITSQNISFFQKYNHHLKREQDTISLSTQNVSYKKDLLEDTTFDTDMRIMEAVDFCWRINKIDENSIKYIPNIMVYHENREKLKNFIIQTYYFGVYYKRLVKKAIENDFLPKKNPEIFSLNQYLTFSLKETLETNYDILSKTKLFLIMILRRIIFRIATSRLVK